MGIKKNLEQQLANLGQTEEKKRVIEEQFRQLLQLMENVRLSGEEVRSYRERLDNILQKSTVTKEQIRKYQQLDDADLTRLDMLDELGKLLTTTPVDTRMAQDYKKHEWASRIITFIIGFTLIALGFAMIILPAPASFEIYTLFYLNADDGVTIMDVISLLIVLSGVYIAITAMKKKTV